MKRLGLSLVGGIIAAVICTSGRLVLMPGITLPELLVSGVCNRILIGLVIGVSRLKINYLWHGALIGLVVTLSYSIGILANGNISGFFVYTMMGVIFGLLIELFVTKICRVRKAD